MVLPADLKGAWASLRAPQAMGFRLERTAVLRGYPGIQIPLPRRGGRGQGWGVEQRLTPPTSILPPSKEIVQLSTAIGIGVMCGLAQLDEPEEVDREDDEMNFSLGPA
jgi:hypothetical protein